GNHRGTHGTAPRASPLMAVLAKICGVNAAPAMTAAIDGGADFVGFVFFPRSPRTVSLDEAADLARMVPAQVRKVAVLVDPTDADIERLVAAVPLDMLQLHGRETPERVAA